MVKTSIVASDFSLTSRLPGALDLELIDFLGPLTSAVCQVHFVVMCRSSTSGEDLVCSSSGFSVYGTVIPLFFFKVGAPSTTCEYAGAYGVKSCVGFHINSC